MPEGLFLEDPRIALRVRAENTIEVDELGAVDAPSASETRRVLHELRVHQIELEMQNEDLRRTQEELEASRARYFDLYDMAPVGYFTLSEHGLILEANFTAAKLLGVTRSGLVGQPFSRFILPENQQTHYQAREHLFTTGTPQVWELLLVRRNASLFWARVEGATAEDIDGARVCRAVVSDITESKRIEHIEEEKRLDAQAQQLQKAESLGRMAGAIAHSFNNSLLVVTGNLEVAIGDLSRIARPVEGLTQALQAAREAAEMSKLMLAYLGETPGKHEPMDLSEICRRCLPILRVATHRDVAIETVCPAPIPLVVANANQIQKVLTNLIFNAWEARRAGRSAIHLSLKTVSPADIPTSHRFPVDWLPDTANHRYACLEVTDEGCGIADKDIEKLFDPFFSSKASDRGLGLPVVLGIVRAHLGSVTVESKPGCGSTFRIYLPLVAGGIPRPRRVAKLSPPHR